MPNELTIQDVLKAKNNYNLALPFSDSRQLNPFFKLSVSMVSVDTDPSAREIYKIGSQKTEENRYEELFILAKPFLERLATTAGIQFSPHTGDVIRIDENTWKSSAFGALRLPDGDLRTSNNFKVIDLVQEEKKHRYALEDKAVRGISEKKAAEDAAKKYEGQWKGKTFFVAEHERKRYVERTLLEVMAQLRADAPQKAATGAILRVIRELLGIKGVYTMRELRKPFAVAKMSFSPDYNDPMVKQMMLQQCMQSVGNLFGYSQPITQTISIPQPCDLEDAGEVRAEDCIEEPQNDYSVEPPEEEPQSRPQDFCCDKCGVVIPEKVWDYSVKRFDRPLCYKCQGIIRNEMRGNRR